jgi:uncharacterized protein YecT (DUF1311 family)
MGRERERSLTMTMRLVSGIRVGQVAAAAAAAVLAGSLAACGATSGSAAGSSPSAASVAASSASAVASASAAPFVSIVEPFDPGHPAKYGPAPASCGGQTTTLAIEQCYQAKTENTDAAIDAAQLAHYNSGSPAERSSILASDSAWLAARQPVCALAYHSGGTIDGINVAACLLDESTARLNAVKGITPPEGTFKNTDNPNPDALSWYTTPGGSRIAMLDTQGDESGGGPLIAWIIIGGSEGFIVNPRQFYWLDGSFTDPGILQSASANSHRVATGVEYQFAIDYSTLNKDPNSAKGAGGFVYAPGTPVAIWK